MKRWRLGAAICLALCGVAAATAARADVASWDKPGMDVWTYPSPLQPGVRTLGPTFLTSPGLDENDQFLPSSGRDPSRRGMSFAVFDTSTSIVTGLPTSYYEISSVTVTFTMQESTAGSIFYDDTPDTNAELLADYVNGDIDTERPMELYGLALNAGYTGFNFGSGGGGEQPFVETVFPYSPTGAEGVLIAYPIAADEAGAYVDVSNSMTGGYSATAEGNLTAPFDPVPWSIGTVAGLANGDLIPENTTFTFELDLELPGVAEYLQQSLADGALGFYLSSNHFAGDPHNGSTIPYPQWYHKEFNAAFGGVAPTLEVAYQVLELPGDELPGDYNLDGVVDAADYSVWRDNLGSATALPNDDTPGVGDDDYARWKASFGNVVGGGDGALALAVPEPGTFGGVLLVAYAIGGVRRRKGCR